MTQTENNDGK